MRYQRTRGYTWRRHLLLLLAGAHAAATDPIRGSAYSRMFGKQYPRHGMNSYYTPCRAREKKRDKEREGRAHQWRHQAERKMLLPKRLYLTSGRGSGANGSRCQPAVAVVLDRVYVCLYLCVYVCVHNFSAPSDTTGKAGFFVFSPHPPLDLATCGKSASPGVSVPLPRNRTHGGVEVECWSGICTNH